MRGHVRKRGQSWTIVFDEGPAAGGKRRQRSKGGFRTKRAAQQSLTSVLGRLGDGSYAEPSKTSLGAFLTEEWLPTVPGTVRPLSLARYQSAVRTHIIPGIGHLRLQSITAGSVNSFYRELEQAGLAVETRRGVHTVLHRALRDAVKWGRLVRNPASLADPPKAERSRVQSWTAKELGRFLEHVRDDTLFPIWRLAATTGMRRGEMLGLTWRCLDLEGARLSVEQQLIPTPGGLSFGPPKSSRSRRTIALDEETVRVLRAHREAQLRKQDHAGSAYDVDDDLVFADALGGPLAPRHLTYRFGQLRKAAGIPAGTLHVLRHTAATLALTDGIPVHIVAARLGDDPKTLLATYAHLLPQSDELAAERLAALIS